MTWINFIAGKYARGTEGHVLSDELVKRASLLESEAYHCVFDLQKELLKIEIDTGRTQIVDGKTKKIYSYHAQNSGVEGPLSFNQYEGPARPAFGLVQFDFDSEDISISYRDALDFIEWVGVDTYHLAFSGSKGFHVSIPLECFGLEVTPELPKLLHDLAAYLATSHEKNPQKSVSHPYFKTMDVKVYNANRKFRILNTKHSKTGLYKTLIHSKMTIEEVIEYSKQRRTSWFPELQVSAPATSLVEAIEESRRQHAYDKAKAGNQNDQTRFESYDGKICIQRMISDKCEEGGRNNTALVIAYDMFKTGKTKDYAVEIMTKWAAANNLELSEALPIVDRAFSESQYYNHGCQDSLKAAKCSAKCPLWKKLDPEKRPIPVDAPKTVYIEAGKKNKMPAAHFIENYLVQNVITIDLSKLWFVNGKLSNQAYIEDLIYCEALLRKRTVDSCSKQTINSHLNIWVENELEKLLRDLKNHIKYGEESPELERWLRAVRPEADATDLAVMSHWIWLVKRKLFSLPVGNHLMPIFCGLTNTGKSVAIRKLIAPLKAIASESDLKRLSDGREDFVLIDSYIMFLDEMAKANSADVESLKTKITADHIEYRKLGTNAKIKGPQNASFIGTSNYSVVDVIKDPTSSRRYYELWVNARCDWKTINEIDYLAIWRSIDETKDGSFYLQGHADVIRERQEVIRDRDSVEEWLEHFELKPIGDHTDREFPVFTLYSDYMEFMAQQKRERYAISLNKFGRLMTSHCRKSRSLKGVTYIVSKNYFSGLNLATQSQNKSIPVTVSRVESAEINF